MFGPVDSLSFVMRARLVFASILLSLSLQGQTTPPAEDPNNRAKVTIGVEPLGDNEQGVVSRITFRFAVPADTPAGVPMFIQGSIMQGGQVVKNFRFPVPFDQRELLRTTQTLREGETEIEARLLIPLEEQAPVILGKTSKKISGAT